MTRILLAFDGSDGAVGVVTALSHWRLHQPTEILLLTVTPPGEWPRAHVSRARELAARSLRRRGATVQLLLKEGYPSDEILRSASEHDAQLIAMGPRKQTALSTLLLGSVTREVLHACRCSLFIGRLSLSTERAMMVLKDHDDLALLSRRWQELPLPHPMELILLAVGSAFPAPRHEVPGSLRHGAPERLLPLARDDEREHLWELLDEGRRTLRATAGPLLAEAVLGSEVEEVLRMERRTTPELIVLRHTGGQDRLVAEARSSILLLR